MFSSFYFVCLINKFIDLFYFLIYNGKKWGGYMKYENEIFKIEYDERDEELVKQIIQSLEQKSKTIMDFFELDKLSKKFNVIIYHNLQDYINLITENGKGPFKYQSWNVASVRNGDVHILSLDLYKKAEGHENCEMRHYLKTLIHEFVHICHEEILLNKNILPALLMEGIATQLADQVYEVNHIDCNAEDLAKNFYKLKNCYGYSNAIMGYLLNTKSHKEVLDILREPHKVNVAELIEQTNNYLDKQNIKQK